YNGLRDPKDQHLAITQGRRVGMNFANTQGNRNTHGLSNSTATRWLERTSNMKLLCCHPSGLMYTKIYLCLEPLGLELVAAAARRAGHDVRMLDLQVSRHKEYFQTLRAW